MKDFLKFARYNIYFDLCNLPL